MRGDDTATETYPQPHTLPTSLLTAAAATAAAAAFVVTVSTSHRGEGEPKIAAVLSPQPLSLLSFFTLFVDDGILIMWKVSGEEDEEDCVLVHTLLRKWGGLSGSLCFS